MKLAKRPRITGIGHGGGTEKEGAKEAMKQICGSTQICREAFFERSIKKDKRKSKAYSQLLKEQKKG